jgi:hypothetical protein
MVRAGYAGFFNNQQDVQEVSNGKRAHSIFFIGIVAGMVSCDRSQTAIHGSPPQ